MMMRRRVRTSSLLVRGRGADRFPRAGAAAAAGEGEREGWEERDCRWGGFGGRGRCVVLFSWAGSDADEVVSVDGTPPAGSEDEEEEEQDSEVCTGIAEVGEY